MINHGGWSIPASFGNTNEEYAAVRLGGAGLIDFSARGRLLVTGAEAVQFLNGLITNDMKTLEEHHWMPAVFPNVQGRLIASVRVIRLADSTTAQKPSPTFLIDTEAETRATVLKMLERFTLAGDFKVTDLTDDWAMVSLQGRDAQRILRQSFGADAEVDLHEALQLTVSGNTMTVIRATHTAEDGFDLFADKDQAEELWQVLRDAGSHPVGFEAFEILRIEGGVARHGTDMDETTIVSETNLDEAVSFSKGCYIGQEIIARIKYRGHVAKKLTGVVFDDSMAMQHGTKLFSEDRKEIGRMTSVTVSPALDRTIGLAYLKYDYLAAETKVHAVSDEREVSGVVVELPFVRGSWYQDQA